MFVEQVNCFKVVRSGTDEEQQVLLYVILTDELRRVLIKLDDNRKSMHFNKTLKVLCCKVLAEINSSLVELLPNIYIAQCLLADNALQEQLHG